MATTSIDTTRQTGSAMERYTDAVFMRDDIKLYFGNGGDASIKYDSTNSDLRIEGKDVNIVAKSLTVGSDLTVSGDMTIVSDVALRDEMTLTSDLTVSGNVDIAGTILGSDTVTATKVMTCLSDLTVTGPVGVTGAITASKIVTCSSDLAVTGPVDITGAVGVTGAVTASAIVTCSSDLAVTGPVGVTGAITASKVVTCSSDLTVTGTAAFNGVTAIACVSDSIILSDMTDNTNATGYQDFTSDTSELPAGALVLGWKAVVSTGFTSTSDTSTSVIEVGISGDTDAFSADTSGSIIAAATKGSATLAASGYQAAAIQPRVTVTEDDDFGHYETGEAVVTVYYLPTG